MLQALARLISLAPEFVPNFAAGPPSHVVAAALALSPGQVREPAGLARVLPRRDGIVQAGSGAVQIFTGHIVAAVLVLWHGS